MNEAERREADGETRIVLTPQARIRRRKPDQRVQFEHAFVLWANRPYQSADPSKRDTPMVLLTFMGLNHHFEIEMPVAAVEALHRAVTLDAPRVIKTIAQQRAEAQAVVDATTPRRLS